MKQHHTPRFLLKNFADSRGLLHVFDKHTGRQRTRNYGAVGYDVDFYDYQRKDGTQESLEGDLGKLESAAATIIRKIVSTEQLVPVTPSEWTTLRRFVLVQYIRTLWWRRALIDLRNLLANEIGVDQLPSELVAALPQSEAEARRTICTMIQDRSPYLEKFLKDEVPILLRSKTGASFWISDQAVFIGNPVGPLGLGQEGASVYLPLSASLTLMLLCKKSADRARKNRSDLLYRPLNTNRSLDVVRDRVIQVNTLQVGFAERFLYSADGEFELAERLIDSDHDWKHGRRPRLRASDSAGALV